MAREAGKGLLVLVAGAALVVLVALAGIQSRRQGRPTVLYTAAHSEVAPFQRVWNPDTNNDYTEKEFASEDHKNDPVMDTLCGTDGTKCPELPAFNGEDYFEAGKPIGCCYNKQDVWERWNKLATRVSKMEGTVAFLKHLKGEQTIQCDPSPLASAHQPSHAEQIDGFRFSVSRQNGSTDAGIRRPPREMRDLKIDDLLRL
ncbi:hypothetical protein T484DRAFT_2470355 [Baffinella frigidus]|nr:hypothetical protein T484DRAFT_2470355 [Cryptophyta sp. CCMP2293]